MDEQQILENFRVAVHEAIGPVYNRSWFNSRIRSLTDEEFLKLAMLHIRSILVVFQDAKEEELDWYVIYRRRNKAILPIFSYLHLIKYGILRISHIDDSDDGTTETFFELCGKWKDIPLPSLQMLRNL